MSDDFVYETRDKKRLAPSTLPLEVPVDPELQEEIKNIPDKLAFKIGEVADIVGVKPYVLRYWETEFESLKPKKSKNNQRMYEKKDVETLLWIKKLLYKDRFSIEGARGALKRLRKGNYRVREVENLSSQMEDIRGKVESLIGDISRLRETVETSGH